MNREHFFKKLQELLEINTELNGEKPLSEIEEWDSINVIGFLAMADKEYGVAISGDEIINAVTIDDLANLIDEKMNQSKSD